MDMRNKCVSVNYGPFVTLNASKWPFKVEFLVFFHVFCKNRCRFCNFDLFAILISPVPTNWTFCITLFPYTNPKKGLKLPKNGHLK